MEKDVSESILKNRSRREYEYRRKNVYYRRLRAIKKIASYIILTAVAVYAAFPPIYYAVETSLNRIGALVQSSISDLVPVHPTLSNYYQLLFKEPFFLWLKNTLVLDLAATAIGVALSITSGIAFSRMNVPLKKALLYMLLILSLFPFTIMVIPFYFMFAELRLVGYYSLIIPYSAGAVIFSSYLIKNAVDAIPKDFEEAAQVDGYTRTAALFRVLVPMSRPVISFAAVVAFMGPYTDYALASTFITRAKFYTMAIASTMYRRARYT